MGSDEKPCREETKQSIGGEGCVIPQKGPERVSQRKIHRGYKKSCGRKDDFNPTAEWGQQIRNLGIIWGGSGVGSLERGEGIQSRGRRRLKKVIE